MTPRPAVALYVHVPFCLSICPYCDFVVYAGRRARGAGNRVGAFVTALVAEIGLRGELARQRFGAGPPLASVYFGGGTPSLLGPAQLERLLLSIEVAFGLAPDPELTLEVNPGRRDRGDLAGFRAAGITRLSIGAQSFQATELRRLGRRHVPGEIAETVGLARAAGFDKLSLDLLYDVPGQTLGSWRATLAAALALEVGHISAYALSLDDPDAEGLTTAAGDHLPLRRGARRWREVARPTQNTDRAANCYELADELLARAGLGWYELSNWARPGHESRHNLAYWQWQPYEAVGPGAHAFDGTLTRRWNAARLEGYMLALAGEAGTKLPPGGQTRLERQTAAAERAMLALRTRTGLDGVLAQQPEFASALAWARAAYLLEQLDAGAVRLSSAGRLLASELFWRLLPERQAEADSPAA